MLKIFRRLILIVLIAIVVILPVAAWVLPVFRVYGAGMGTTLREGDLVVALPTKHYREGDLVSFYINHKLLIKRVVAVAGQTVDITRDGEVYVDQRSLNEPYVTQRSRGDADVTFPVVVPEGSVFVLGDNRSETIDSRKQEIGCIEESKITGMLICRLWPPQDIGLFQLPKDMGWAELLLEALKQKLR